MDLTYFLLPWEQWLAIGLISFGMAGLAAYFAMKDAKLVPQSPWETYMRFVRECMRLYHKHGEIVREEAKVISYTLHKADKPTTYKAIKAFIKKYEENIGPFKVNYYNKKRKK